MIVTEFQLDRFRGGNPLRVLDLGNGLNVALVRSAAGRAQLLNVIPTSFYGSAPFFWDGDEDETAGDISGQLVLRTDHGVFRIERDALNGRVYVHSPDGTEFNHEHLDELLDGVHLNEYRDLFTFNLQRLRQLVGQGSESIPKLVKMARFLKSASQDSADSSLSSAVSSAAALTRQDTTIDLAVPEASLRDLYQLLKSEANSTGEVDKEEQLPKDREKITRDLKKVDAAIQDAQSKLQHLDEEIQETQCALAINRGQARLGALDRELAELSEVTVPGNISNVTEGSLERLDVKITECKQQLKQLTAERDELIRQGKALTRDERAAPLATQIESLLLHEKSTIKEEETIERLKLKIDDLQSRVDLGRDQVRDRSFEHTSSFAGDQRAVHRIEELDRRLREAERDQEVAEQSLVYAENASLSIEAATGSAYGSATTRPEDAIALHEAETRVQNLRQRLGQDDRRAQLELERADAIRRIRELYRDQMLPFQTIMAMGVPFMIGVAMIIYGLTQYTPNANWRLVGFGFLLSAATAIFKMMIDRDRSEALVSSRSRLTRLNRELEHHAEAGGYDAADVRTQLAAAEADFQRLQSRFGAQAQVSPVSPAIPVGESVSVETARVEMEQSQRRLRDVTGQWRELLISLDLAATLTPSQAREALGHRAMNDRSHETGGSEYDLQLAAAQNELEIRRDWLSVVAGKLRQLLKDLGLPTSGMLTEQFATLRQAYSDYQDRRQTRRQLARSIKRIRQKAGQVQEAGRRYLSQRKELAQDSTSKNSQQQLQRQMRKERRKLLEQQRELFEEDIEEIRQRYNIESKTPLAEFTDEELEARLTSQRDKIESIREKRLRQSEKRGRLRAMLSLDSNESSESVSWQAIFEQTKLVRDAIRAASHQQIDVPAVAAAVTSQSPEYLGRASEFLGQLSGGQFQTIDLENEDRELIVIDEQNRVAVIDDIHPNHLPNIYFSLWLARLEAYADRGIRLPIVMEDPLEATRESRRGTVAQMLTDFAALGHQLVLVTAHPNTAEHFARLGVPIADFSQREPIDEPVESIASEDYTSDSRYPVPDVNEMPAGHESDLSGDYVDYDEEEYVRYVD